MRVVLYHTEKWMWTCIMTDFMEKEIKVISSRKNAHTHSFLLANKRGFAWSTFTKFWNESMHLFQKMTEIVKFILQNTDFNYRSWLRSKLMLLMELTHSIVSYKRIFVYLKPKRTMRTEWLWIIRVQTAFILHTNWKTKISPLPSKA